MSFNQFRSNVNDSRTTLRVGYINNDLQYLVSLDKDLANALLASANALTSILAGFLLGYLKWLLHLHPEITRKPNSFLTKGFMVMAASHRGCWQFLVDGISLCYSDPGRRSLMGSIITLSLITAVICTGFQYSLNFLLASSNQGAYSIFGTDFGMAPFNWSAGASNSISGGVEHIARGSDYDIFDAWARGISLQLGQEVEAVGFGNDSGLTVSKQVGCWFGDHFCLDGSIGNLLMHFRVDTSQIGVLSRKKVSIEGRSRCSQVDVDEVMAQTSQQYSNANMTAIDFFEFGSLSQNGSITPVSWSTFSALSTTHDTDSTTFWADASGRPGNYSFPENFNLVDAHLTLIFLPATILPYVNGSNVDSVFGEWPFRYGNITNAYNKPRLLACRDDSRLCVANNCTQYGGADQVTPAAERLFRHTGIPRDFVFLSTHAADGMVSGPVRLLRNKALMVNDFVAEGNTLDVSSYAIPEVVRWFALSASATTALPGRIASGHFARKWVLSGVTGETTPTVTGDSIERTNATSIIDRTAKELSRITIGVDQQRQLVNILPILSIGVVFLVIAFAKVLIFLAKIFEYGNRFMNLLIILDSFTDLQLLRRLFNIGDVELQQTTTLDH
ncbi:hypothetical protein BGZ57DRAFT_855122 [Hyaloscypha finlandica]|nr:hypothetical protein BGZ57DRAFT_855122 [Hyaloscypha finlandica]